MFIAFAVALFSASVDSDRGAGPRIDLDELVGVALAPEVPIPFSNATPERFLEAGSEF